MPADPAVVYTLFGAYIVGSLLAYERWGVRLGGVLALPYLVVYALHDLSVLLLFGLAAATTYLVGEVVHRTTLIYGRRMLVAFLLISLVSSAVFNQLVHVVPSGVFLPVLPGLFAYNLHREGRPVWNTLLFIGALLGVLLVSYVGLSALGLLHPRGVAP